MVDDGKPSALLRCSGAKLSGGDTACCGEFTNEMTAVIKAALHGDVGDAVTCVEQQLSGAPQTAVQQIFARCTVGYGAKFAIKQGA